MNQLSKIKVYQSYVEIKIKKNRNSIFNGQIRNAHFSECLS